MSVYHLADDGSLPAVPPELHIKAHIFKEEEFAIGIEPQDTSSWRDANNMPHSDIIEQFENDRKRGRAESNVSEASITSSRQPSPSKIQRR